MLLATWDVAGAIHTHPRPDFNTDASRGHLEGALILEPQKKEKKKRKAVIHVLLLFFLTKMEWKGFLA